MNRYDFIENKPCTIKGWDAFFTLNSNNYSESYWTITYNNVQEVRATMKDIWGFKNKTEKAFKRNMLKQNGKFNTIDIDVYRNTLLEKIDEYGIEEIRRLLLG